MKLNFKINFSMWFYISGKSTKGEFTTKPNMSSEHQNNDAKFPVPF